MENREYMNSSNALNHPRNYHVSSFAELEAINFDEIKEWIKEVISLKHHNSDEPPTRVIQLRYELETKQENSSNIFFLKIKID